MARGAASTEKFFASAEHSRWVCRLPGGGGAESAEPRETEDRDAKRPAKDAM
jgi:hypothetical protein